jgi:MOSC domain-containing protein YiiM
MSRGLVLSVNVGRPREIEWHGKRAATAIWKAPVAGRVAVGEENLAGDDQADRSVHGGLDKALYAYAREDAEWWEAEIGRAIELGGFGENLTLRGVDVSRALIGERWAIGSAVVEVAQPRIPCWKLGARMDDPTFPRRFLAADRPGAYLRVLEQGELASGDAVAIVRQPHHAVTVADVAAIYHRQHDRVAELLDVPDLSSGWHVWARRRVEPSREAATRRAG